MKSLSITENRKLLLYLISQSLSLVTSNKIINTHLRYDEAKDSIIVDGKHHKLKGGKVWIFGAGKASGKMALAAKKILGKKVAGGLVLSSKTEGIFSKLRIMKSSHPFPTRRSILLSRGLLEFAQNVPKNDTILFMLSGGASSMFAIPAPTISESSFIRLHKDLVKSGLPIDEMNIVRKHISKVKGGRLAKLLSDKNIITLAMSDIPSGDITAIGSGPTDGDKSTFSKALSIIRSSNIELPPDVEKYMVFCAAKRNLDTPFTRPKNSKVYLLADNTLIQNKIKSLCNDSGIDAKVLKWPKNSNVNHVAKYLANNVGKLKSLDKKHVIIMGGEIALFVPGAASGKGGRNQHFSITLLEHMKKYDFHWACISFATDGVDFMEGVGGGIVDNFSMKKAYAKHEFVEKYKRLFDSNTLLEQIDGVIKTDATGINFSDIIIAVF